jgi:hypothetical protein
MREHFSLCEQTYSTVRAPLLMRKFCIKYSQSHPDHEVVRLAIVKMRTRDEFDRIMSKHYADDRPGRYIPSDVHCSQAEC